MISDDEYLERLVAGIHAVTTAAADVRWNEILNGRQFDVAVRFKHGTLSYLVLVEVKNRTRKATASDVEAFVTKARDQSANKAVFVTAAGFQSGAIEVAKRHGVELFTVTVDDSTPVISPTQSVVVLSRGPTPAAMPPKLELAEPQLIANILSVTLTYIGGSKASLPTEQTQMRYYASKSLFADGQSIMDHIESRPIFNLGLNESRSDTIKLGWRGSTITPPDNYFIHPGRVKAITYASVGKMGRSVSGNVMFEPASFTSPVIYTNVLTGEEQRFRVDQLPLGLELAEVGKFYSLEHPLRYYFCERISNNLATWWMVESFQCEQLIQMEFTQDIKYSVHMIPVTDKATLARLAKRLADMQTLQNKQTG